MAAFLPGLSDVADAETFGFRRGAFLANAFGARPAGMGEAFTALADDAMAVNLNPGGLGQLKSKQVVATYDKSVQGLGLYHAALGMPVAGGVAGMSVAALDYGSYEVRDLSGREQGTESAMDMAFGVSYAMANARLLPVPGWSGATVELVQEAVGGLLAAVSLGGVLPMRTGFSVGWAVQHLGLPADGFSPPLLFKGGVAISAGPGAVVCADLGYGAAEKTAWLSVGGEAQVGGILTVRAGYRQDFQDQGLGPLAGLGLGGGLRVGHLGLDYAYLPRGELGSSHRMSLSYAFVSRRALIERIKEGPEVLAEEDYRAGLRYAGAGDYDKALRKAKEAVEGNPQHWQAWRLLGTCRYRKGDLTGAVEAYERSLEIFPENPALKGFLARIAAGGPAPEIRIEQAANTEAFYRQAMQLYGAGKYKESWEKAYDVLALDPDHWQSWQLVGSCQYALGDALGAIESFRWALSINPDNSALKAWIDQLESR